MAPQIQRRAAAVAVLAAGPALALGALAAGPARAESASTESGKSIVFDGGGLLGVSCAARPDVRSVTVPADTTVRVVNRTGYRARLLLDGAIQGEIQDSGSAEVVFRRGPVTLKLKPSCVLSESSKAVRVHVEAAPPPVPDEPEPDPAAPLPDAPAATPDADPSPSAPGSMPDSGLPGAGSVRAGHSGSGLPGGAQRRQRSGGAGLPDGGVAGRSGSVAVRPGAGAAGRLVVPGMPPGNDPLLVPGAPTTDLPPAVGTPVVAVAAEPVAALEPVTETGPTGLLAIVATVCAAGVTAGVIRAAAAQRANRPKTV